MKKIPTLFVRDPDNLRYVTRDVTPGCEWVLAGEGTATRKYDGTCVMLDEHGRWWARREVRPGKPEPDGWVEVDHDETTGKRVGWEPIENSGYAKHLPPLWVMRTRPGTYELCGPKVNGNPEGFESAALIRHANAKRLPSFDRPTYDGLAGYLPGWAGEGIVWHHPDGRMAKLKGRDFPPRRPA